VEDEEDLARAGEVPGEPRRVGPHVAGPRVPVAEPRGTLADALRFLELALDDGRPLAGDGVEALLQKLAAERVGHHPHLGDGRRVRVRELGLVERLRALAVGFPRFPVVAFRQGQLELARRRDHREEEQEEAVPQSL